MTSSAIPESQNHALIMAFDVIVLLGFLLLLCTLLPALLSKAVRRSTVWYSLVMAWLVHSSSYALLVGRQEGPDPPRDICLVQTVLIYAAPTLVSTATLCYYIEIFLVIYTCRSGILRQPSSARVVWLVITPWIVFLTIIVVVLLVIFLGDRLSQVERQPIGFYCHLIDQTPTKITASVVVAGMAVLLSLEGYTGYLMFQHWSVFKMLSKNDREIFITLYLRLVLCTLAAASAFVLSSLIFAPEIPRGHPTICYPALSIIIAFAFGTQKDLLRTWLFWRSPKPYGSVIFNNGTRNDNLPISTTVVYTSTGENATIFSDGLIASSQQNPCYELNSVR